jgi:hypothetical protein
MFNRCQPTVIPTMVPHDRQTRTGAIPAMVSVTALMLGCSIGGAYAADDKPKMKDPPRWQQMDYGPYLSASIISDPAGKYNNEDGNWIGSDVTPRGFAIKLADNWNAGVVFDADTMRMSAGWINGKLKLQGLISDGSHGTSPALSAPPLFQTPQGPGWTDENGSFKDPRPDTIAPLPPPGPLPAAWAKYKGLYIHGDQTVLSYTVGSCSVLESPGIESKDAAKVLVRAFSLGASQHPLGLMIAAVKDNKTPLVTVAYKSGILTVLDDLVIAISDAPAGSKLQTTSDGQCVLSLPALNAPANFKVFIAGGGSAAKDAVIAIAEGAAKAIDLTSLTKGGPSKWGAPVETVGKLGGDAEPYVVDSLTIPYDNPAKSWMRTAAFDFFKNGTSAAITTWSGDVWIVSGIDDKLDHLSWKRFATGLHQPLGLKIVDDVIYTVGHDQITRLVDLNHDGEADFYECFNNNWELTTAFHAFAFDLHTDAAGNFYFAFGSPVHGGGRGFQKITNSHGTIFKVSKDGSKIEPYATGLRAPNGMSVSPTGQVTVGDNEGSWVPTSPLHWVKPGMFLGVPDVAHGAKVEQPKPLLWLSHNGSTDNSCGGQAWVTSDKWGPFTGMLLHESYGQSSLFLIMKEEREGQMQGGAVKFPLKFTSSAMRARFNAHDGQLYVCGLKGWQTNAGKDGGFDRVRYTGKPVHMPIELHATTKGLRITYTCALDPATANDAQGYNIEAWNYQWTADYGSPELSTMPGDKKPGHDTLTVKSAQLQADGKTVFLEIPDIKPVMQMKIKAKLQAADGTAISSEIYTTIYNLAP